MDCPANCDGRFKRRQADGYLVDAYFLSHKEPQSFVPFENGQDDLLVFDISAANRISIKKGGYPEVIANIGYNGHKGHSEFPSFQNELQGEWTSVIEDVGSIVLTVESDYLNFRYIDADGNTQNQRDQIQNVFTSFDAEYKDVYLMEFQEKNIVTFKLENNHLAMHEGGEGLALFNFYRNRD